jgi:glycosyltransferase involved in cell wall biosynthesis
VKRVAMLVTGLEPGGAEIQTVHLARSLAARGWDVTVLAFRAGALEAELRAGGVPVRVLHPARLLLQLARLQPTIVHAHLFHANLAARLARLLCPIPVVISTVHSVAESSRRSGSIRPRDFLYRVTDGLADATVFVCAAAADRHLGAGAIYSGRARVIPNGVDSARFRPDAARRAEARAALGLAGEFAWLGAGRLMWKKNYPLMLEAMARQSEGILFIAGAGPDEAQLRRLAGPNVRFLGEREDIPALMDACDGFVLSSDVEGLPMVLLEAAASGLPQVACGCGGVGEAVRHERTGYVVPPGDAGALAAAMNRLAALPPETRAAMGRAAREHALARFDLESVTSQWEDLYRQITEAARAAAREPNEPGK